ncbi:ryanodine receptor 3-like [Lethenteron reissneri]|uniref:ryanodine receptor 3-like n=1 Tax=Lethenteron reissneri TaxID=7753 RepID=UPI002AB5FDD1|nr:ryanodine receptor 3-like [Lethenteron reissneri]
MTLATPKSRAQQRLPTEMRQLTIFNSQAWIRIGGRDRPHPFQGLLSGLYYNGLKVLNLAAASDAHTRTEGALRVVRGMSPHLATLIATATATATAEPTGPAAAAAAGPRTSTATLVETTTTITVTTTTEQGRKAAAAEEEEEDEEEEDEEGEAELAPSGPHVPVRPPAQQDTLMVITDDVVVSSAECPSDDEDLEECQPSSAHTNRRFRANADAPSQVEHPHRSKKAVWHKLLSKQRKRAVVACFRMAPLYNLPRHRAINLFLDAYKKHWIETEENAYEDKLIDDIAKSIDDDEEEKESEDTEVETHPDPLHQLILYFSRTALTEKSKLEEDFLYMAYADIMAKSCHAGIDEEEEDSATFEEKEMEKQKLQYQQSRLHERGAAEMVLQMLGASKGVKSPMVRSTLKLGIAVLNGGNCIVQNKMLDYLKDKKDSTFFQSVAGLMQICSVLDLNAFERQNKAEGLGMVTGGRIRLSYTS